jgi:hypothetical protein
MDITHAREHAQAWVEAFNAHDLDAVMAFYADDIELRSPLAARAGATKGPLQGLGGDGVLKGKAAVREFFALGVANPKLQFELVDVLVGVRAITVLYRNQAGVLVADNEEFDADGRICRMSACYGAAVDRSK